MKLDSRFSACIAAVVMLHVGVIYKVGHAYYGPQQHVSGTVNTSAVSVRAFQIVSVGTLPEHNVDAATTVRVTQLTPHLTQESDPGHHQEPTQKPSPVALAQTRYFYGPELTKRPEPREELCFDGILVYLRGASGSLVADIWIAKTGEIDRVDIETSDLPQEFNDQMALLLKSAAFRPGEVAGEAVASKLRMEINASPMHLSQQ